MKNVMKKMMTGLLVMSSMTTQAFDYGESTICSNDNISVEVFFDGAPRGGDLVVVDLGNGEKYTLYTKFSKTERSTRCGIGKRYEASLYRVVGDVDLQGEMSISQNGFHCSHQQASGHINIKLNDQNINESLSCN